MASCLMAAAAANLVVPRDMVVREAKGLLMVVLEEGLNSTMQLEGLVEEGVPMELEGVLVVEVVTQGVLVGIIIVTPVGEVEGHIIVGLISKTHVV